MRSHTSTYDQTNSRRLFSLRCQHRIFSMRVSAVSSYLCVILLSSAMLSILLSFFFSASHSLACFLFSFGKRPVTTFGSYPNLPTLTTVLCSSTLAKPAGPFFLASSLVSPLSTVLCINTPSTRTSLGLLGTIPASYYDIS
jgi:hypothetical protein